MRSKEKKETKQCEIARKPANTQCEIKGKKERKQCKITKRKTHILYATVNCKEAATL